MNPTEFHPAQFPPTIQGVIDELRKYGVDRGTIVRPAKDGQPAALAIFLLSNAAVREVGPYLRNIFASLPPQPPHTVALVDGESHVLTAIAAIEQAGLLWSYGTLFPYRTGLHVILTGAAVTHELADGLTARGCTTNLT